MGVFKDCNAGIFLGGGKGGILPPPENDFFPELCLNQPNDETMIN